MFNLKQTTKREESPPSSKGNAFRNEEGAIDLASIMVGIIVIGLIGGVISATVFAVIPWAQDNAAKQQLDSIVAAESAYIGLTSAVPPVIQGDMHLQNSYGDSGRLADAGLLQKGDNYCAVTVNDSKSYIGYSKSGSGNVFTVSENETKPKNFTVPHTEDFKNSLPADCSFLFDGGGTDGNGSEEAGTEPEEDFSAFQLVMTYSSPTDTTVELPIRDGEGIVTWSDDPANVVEYSGSDVVSKNLAAGESYTATVEGTFNTIDYTGRAGAEALTAVTNWGEETGTVLAANAFAGARNLTDVPASVPSTITDMTKMFSGTAKLNDADVEKWDVKNVKKLTLLFEQSAYAGDLSEWDTSNATNMAFVLGESSWKPNGIKYNPLDTTTTLTYKCDSNQLVELPIRQTTSENLVTWSDGTMQTIRSNDNLQSSSSKGSVTSKTLTKGKTYTVAVEGTYKNFSSAAEEAGARGSLSGADCLRSVDHWGDDTGIQKMNYAFSSATNVLSVPSNIPPTVHNLTGAFREASSFNQDISSWKTGNVTLMGGMFQKASSFNQPLNSWDVSKVTNMSNMFENASSFNQPLNSWNTSNVLDMGDMFSSATNFNSAIGNWDTGKVTAMDRMFANAKAFNQNIANWNVSKVYDMSYMFSSASVFNQPIAVWNTQNVNNMNYMFVSASAFNQPIGVWNTSKALSMEGMFNAATSFNYPLGSWDTTKVTTMASMFSGATSFNQDIRNWKTGAVTTMHAMFKDATSFNSPLTNWDTSKVTNMNSMFQGAKVFNQNIKSWNVSKVTTAKLNFRTDSALTAAYSPFG